MKSIHVQITGETPLLMNNPAQMMQNISTSIRKKTKERNPLQEATSSAYLLKDGTLFLPSNAVFAMIIEASKAFRIKNQSLSKMLGGSIRIEPEQISLGTKKFEVDSKRVVIMGSGVIRHRARLFPWMADFVILYDDVWLPGGPDILKEVLVSAGKRVGILDYRPSKKGPYGTFSVSKWEVKK